MNRRLIKYFLVIGVAGLLAYNSVYFKKLDAQKAQIQTTLNPAEFAKAFWKNQFTTSVDSAVEISHFIKMLQADSNKVFDLYAHSPGIGNTSFFLLKGEGVIKSMDENEVIVLAKSDADAIPVNLNMGLYFGNAVRDVSGLIKMGDFSSTMDFNIVSSELNKIVSKEVVAPFKTKAVKGATVQFVGCAEMNKGDIQSNNIQLLPVRLNLIK